MAGKKRSGLKRWIRRNKPLAVFLGVVLVLGVVGLIWCVRQLQLRRAAEAQRAQVESTMPDLQNQSYVHYIDVNENADGTRSYTIDGVFWPNRPYFFAGNHIFYNGKEYWRNTATKAYLFLGVDTRGTLQREFDISEVGLSDGIFLVAHNTAKDTVKIIQIPRDTMTPIYVTDENNQIIGRTIDHLTYAWMYGDSHQLSGEYAMQAVTWLMGGLPIDGFMAGGMDIIKEANDAIGGVTVTIEADDLVNADPSFEKGKTVHLEGDLAERFVRYRDRERDFTAIDRMYNQKQFVMAFEKQLFAQQKKDKQTIPRLMDAIEGNIITNMQKAQYMKIAMDIAAKDQLLTDEDYIILPGESRRGEVFDEFYADELKVTDLILDVFYRPA